MYLKCLSRYGSEEKITTMRYNHLQHACHTCLPFTERGAALRQS
jgi:hypothetical protein